MVGHAGDLLVKRLPFLGSLQVTGNLLIFCKIKENMKLNVLLRSTLQGRRMHLSLGTSFCFMDFYFQHI